MHRIKEMDHNQHGQRKEKQPMYVDIDGNELHPSLTNLHGTTLCHLGLTSHGALSPKSTYVGKVSTFEPQKTMKIWFYINCFMP